MREIPLSAGCNRLLAGQLLDGAAQRIGVVVHEAHGRAFLAAIVTRQGGREARLEYVHVPR